MDCSPPGSPVPGILQARTLEWVAISFSNAWKWKVKVKSLSHIQPTLSDLRTAAYQVPLSMGVSRQEHWSGVPLPFPHSLLAAAAKSLQSCLALCNPIDSSPPGSATPRILQTRTLESVAISFLESSILIASNASLIPRRTVFLVSSILLIFRMSLPLPTKQVLLGVPLPILYPTGQAISLPRFSR